MFSEGGFDVSLSTQNLNDIFQQEQYHLFQLQTGLRDDIKEKSEQKIRDLIAQVEAESAPNEHLQFLFVKLRKQLDQHKGKKVYGYLPKQIKATVNEIVSHLSSEPAIEELYEEWNKVNREKLSLYYENKDPTIPLVDNKEFRSIKNMIIKAVMELPPDVEITTSEVSKDVNDDEPIQIRPRFYEKEPVLKFRQYLILPRLSFITRHLFHTTPRQLQRGSSVHWHG